MAAETVMYGDLGDYCVYQSKEDGEKHEEIINVQSSSRGTSELGVQP